MDYSSSLKATLSNVDAGAAFFVFSAPYPFFSTDRLSCDAGKGLGPISCKYLTGVLNVFEYRRKHYILKTSSDKSKLCLAY